MRTFNLLIGQMCLGHERERKKVLCSGLVHISVKETLLFNGPDRCCCCYYSLYALLHLFHTWLQPPRGKTKPKVRWNWCENTLTFKLFSNRAATVAGRKRAVWLPREPDAKIWTRIAALQFKSSKAKTLASQKDEASNVTDSMSEKGFFLWFKCHKQVFGFKSEAQF